MMSFTDNRFQDFFIDDKYVTIKNDLYNYLLRKSAIAKALINENIELILDVGSGLSPVVSKGDVIVYAELSLRALQILKSKGYRGHFVVADCSNLPFKDRKFSQVVCSEVLEHIHDDQGALREMARILKPSGSLVLTFPHRSFYYASDDHFVGHKRRYELAEMCDYLRIAGLEVAVIRKVLGPLEKLTMLLAVHLYKYHQKHKIEDRKTSERNPVHTVFMFIFKWGNRMYSALAWLDARIMPRSFSTVLLIKAGRSTG